MPRQQVCERCHQPFITDDVFVTCHGCRIQDRGKKEGCTRFTTKGIFGGNYRPDEAKENIRETLRGIDH